VSRRRSTLGAGPARAHRVTQGLKYWARMELSKIIALLALVLAGVLVSEYSRAAESDAVRAAKPLAIAGVCA
jgi:hypothetical protein